MAQKNGEGELRLPPYVSYKTFQGFIQKLKDTVVPPQIDSSVLRNYAGSVARKLTAGLRFLGLIEEKSRATDKLARLVKAYGTPEWPSVLSAILFDAYKDLIGDLKLEIATAAMLEDRFRKWGADGTAVQACVAFYIAAMRDAGVPVSPLILNRPRGRPTGGRPRKRQEETTEQETTETPGTMTSQAGTVRFAFPIPDKAAAAIYLPGDVSIEDWEMVSAMVKAYIQRRKKDPKNAEP